MLLRIVIADFRWPNPRGVVNEAYWDKVYFNLVVLNGVCIWVGVLVAQHVAHIGGGCMS